MISFLPQNRIYRVPSVLQAELKVKGVVLDPPVPVYLDAQQQRHEAPPQTGASALELTCLGKVCLARQALWRKGSKPSIFLPHCMLLH